MWQSVQYGESVDCFYSGDSRKSCDSCESGESRASNESGVPGEIGNYDESHHFCKSGDSRLYGDSGDPSEFGDYDKLGKTGDVYEYCDFMNMMILVIQVYLFIMVNVAKLVILVASHRFQIAIFQTKLIKME